mgnify:CR=1 FL=1
MALQLKSLSKPGSKGVELLVDGLGSSSCDGVKGTILGTSAVLAIVQELVFYFMTVDV